MGNLFYVKRKSAFKHTKTPEKLIFFDIYWSTYIGYSPYHLLCETTYEAYYTTKYTILVHTFPKNNNVSFLDFSVHSANYDDLDKFIFAHILRKQRHFSILSIKNVLFYIASCLYTYIIIMNVIGVDIITNY